MRISSVVKYWIILSFEGHNCQLLVYRTGLLLLLLSRFGRVWLCATPQTAAHQAPLSLGFSRQEHWSGLPFPSPMHESESEVAQSCPTLSDPMACSPPGSSIHGIFQARVLECKSTKVLEYWCHYLLRQNWPRLPYNLPQETIFFPLISTDELEVHIFSILVFQKIYP